jgi:hypothetical protein
VDSVSHQAKEVKKNTVLFYAWNCRASYQKTLLLDSEACSVNLPMNKQMGYEVESWLKHYATSQTVAGSRPDEVNEFFQFT